MAKGLLWKWWKLRGTNVATTKTKKAVKKAEWKGYIKVSLTKEQDAEFDVWKETVTDVFAWMDTLVGDGYKLSFSFDDYHSGVSAALYASGAKMETAGYSLTSWGENVEEAYLMLCYKHFVICNQFWEIPEYQPEKSYAKRG
jgi:hypothetical protein